MQQFRILPLLSLPSLSGCLVQIHMVSPLLFFFPLTVLGVSFSISDLVS